MSKTSADTRPAWTTFLVDVDRELDLNIELHCVGGFVLATLHSLPRPTGDVDFIVARPREGAEHIVNTAGLGSALARRHKLYFQFVAAADYPDNYEERLIDVTPQGLSKLNLLALGPEDLVLSKLTRNSPKDRHDVMHLAQRGVIDLHLLENLYHENLRPYLSNEAKHDLTLELWIEEIRESTSL